MGRYLLIDDERGYLHIQQQHVRMYGRLNDMSELRICRSFHGGMEALKEGNWDCLYLDHDLHSYDADGRERTGTDVMNFLEQNPQFLPKRIICVSANPVGRKRIETIIQKIYGA
jgi:hypothetical protein